MAGRARVSKANARALLGPADATVNGYGGGTRDGIRVEEDGLMAAGVPGKQLTRMDAGGSATGS